MKIEYVYPDEPTPSDGEIVGTCGHTLGSVWGVLRQGEITFEDGCKARRIGACEECVNRWGDHPKPVAHGTWIAATNGVLLCCSKTVTPTKTWLN